MKLSPNRHMKITKQYFGNENTPILIIDDFVEQIEQLTEFSKNLKFEQNSPYYPGVRAATPKAYQQLIIDSLNNILVDFFELPSSQLVFPVSHYSIVTTPPDKLNLLQKIPHFDSLDKNGLATVHYLFKGNLGGTSFYRHRKTGYEKIDQQRQLNYLRSLESENGGPNMPKNSDGYINGDTPIFERIVQQPAKFNRMIIYRRNSLHSGSIAKDLVTNSPTSHTRLTISSFIDCK